MEKDTWAEPNNFSMVFRCTTVEFAENFLEKGQIKFNTPESWVKYAEQHGDGRGDFLEGTIALSHNLDIEHLVEINKKYEYLPDLMRIPYKNRVLLKSHNDMELPCYCFYILKNSMFEAPIESGKQKLNTTVPPEYFRDFADKKTLEEINELEKKERPAIIVITNYKLFEERLISFLLDIGVGRSDIIIGRVEYMDYEKYGVLGWWDFGQKPPMELLVKEKRFIKQSEARVIVNTKNPEIKKKLEMPLELGNMEDIASIIKGYFYDGIRIEMEADIIAKE